MEMASEIPTGGDQLTVKNGNERDVESSSALSEVTGEKDQDTVEQTVIVTDAPESGETNPYAYLERDEFCSERYKIELRNLPKQYGFKELKKFLLKSKVNPHKIKKGNAAGHFIFISFRSPEERDQALAVLHGQKWKNKTLEASHANAAKDPLIRKRAETAEIKKEEEVFSEPISEVVKKVTVPWFDVPYDEQLRRKTDAVKSYMVGLEKDLCNTNFALKKLPRPLWQAEDILPSPVTANYRNKCEFSIGYNPETKEQTVGFRLASYKQGSKAIGPVQGLPHVPELMVQGALAFENFIKNGPYEPFDPETRTGVWKQLTVRTSGQGDLMLYVIVNRKELDDEALGKLKDELAALGSSTTPKITSVFWKILEEQGQQQKNPAELLFGETCITETMCGLTFRISPDSFFQVNVKGAEVLANAVQQHAELDEDTCLLDVCCGTGTLGLCLAKYCGEVHGVDIIPSAIEDARANAQQNNLSEKCQFYCGKAEDVVDCLTYQTTKKKIVAILDPPRAGVHIKVLQTLRRCAKINTVIFVSCDMEAAKKNFVDFARPESKKYRLSPFIPRKLIPVDLFPLTPHMELVVILKRIREETPYGHTDTSAMPTSDTS